MVYVTFQIRYAPIYPKTIKHHAVRCKDMEEALEVAACVCSYISTRYVRINKCGKFRKDAIISNPNNIIA